MRKITYLGAMIVAFSICTISVIRFPFLGDGIVLCHVDFLSKSLPVSLHGSVNFVMVILLVWVFLKSLNNYLVVVNTRHTTTLEKR